HSPPISMCSLSLHDALPISPFYCPWQFLYFFPEPHGQGSFLPTLTWRLTGCFLTLALPSPACICFLSTTCSRFISSSERTTVFKTNLAVSSSIFLKRFSNI